MESKTKTHATAKVKSSPKPVSAPVATTAAAKSPGVVQLLGNQAMLAMLQSGMVQAKLSIGRPNDPLEREADHVADTVLAMPDPAVSPAHVNGNMGSNVQRKCASCEAEEKSEKPCLQPKLSSSRVSRIQRACAACEEEEEKTKLRTQAKRDEGPLSVSSRGFEGFQSGGRPLPTQTQSYFSSRFGRAFSQVRVHDDRSTAALARSINARAFTIGKHIGFARGQYAPETLSGKRLLAHELTHVVQQSNVPVPVIRRQEDPMTERGRRFASRQPPGAQRRDTTRYLRGEVEVSCGRYDLVGIRNTGRQYGFELSEAVDQVQMHNTDPVPDDWDGQPAYRRRFIAFTEGTPQGQWRVEPPPIELENPDELRCFIEGINQGLESYRRVVAIAEPIAEALNLVALALTVRGLTTVGRVAPTGRPTPPTEPVVTRGAGGRPRLVLVHSSGRVEMRGGRVVAPRRSGTSTPRASARGDRSSAAVELAPEAVEAPVTEPHLRPVPNPAPEAIVPPSTGSGTVSPPVRAPLPQPARAERPRRRRRVGRCELVPIAPLGGDPLSGLYCGSVTGGNRSYRITLLNDAGRSTGRWAEIDSLRGSTWYECKCGYEALLRGAARGEAVARSILEAMDGQVLNHLTIATECGLQYRFIVSNDYVADILRQRWFGNVTVEVREWEPCD